MEDGMNGAKEMDIHMLLIVAGYFQFPDKRLKKNTSKCLLSHVGFLWTMSYGLWARAQLFSTILALLFMVFNCLHPVTSCEFSE